MARKASLLKQSILVSACFLLGVYAFLSHTASPVSSNNPSLVLFGESEESSTKVKVYLYEDLPWRFREGIIHHHARARGSPDPSKATYPGHQHMGEWFLYSDLARPQSHRLHSPVVRVLDPEEADLFYVPVFSSLSLIVNPSQSKQQQQQHYSDEEMQEALVHWLEGQHYWRRSNGRDHVFMASDPNALHRVLDRLNNAVLLLSDFGRLTPIQASLVKDVIVPYSHRINTYHRDIGLANRNTLLFFMGNRYRKDGGKIRDLLFQMLESEEDVIIKHGTQSRENRRAATHGMHTSKFCLNPAGDTPSACRLFDAIVSLCVPVIVSDSIELPFEDVIDYRKIAVFVGTEAALKPGYLVKLLRGVSHDTILDYQRELREVKRYFEYGDPNGTVNQIWREVAQKVPLIKLMINRDKRLMKRESIEPDCTCLCTNQTGLLNSL